MLRDQFNISVLIAFNMPTLGVHNYNNERLEDWRVKITWNYVILLYLYYCRSKNDEYGFERDDDFNYDEYRKFMESYLTVLTKSSMKWTRLMSNNPQLKRNGRLRTYVRNGIPITLRAQVGLVIRTKF